MKPTTTRPHGQMPTLNDGVVLLRALSPGDTEAMTEQSGEPGMIRWTQMPHPYTRQDAESFLAAVAQGWAQGTSYLFAIESQGRFAGSLDFRRQGAGLAEIGFSLMNWAEGRGLMTRALRLAINWAFSQAQIEVLHWKAHVGNWRSRRVAWAVGFQIASGVQADGGLPGLLEHRGARVDGWFGTLRRGERLQPAHSWFDPALITGNGIILREHRDQDVPRMVEASRDPQSRRWLSHLPLDYTPEHAREHLVRIRADHAAGRALFWAVADPLDERLLGEITVFVRDRQARQSEVGYLTHPDARGRGVTTEAVRLAVRHALLPPPDGGLGMTRVLLRAADSNIASQRVAQKNGFRRVGLDRQADLLRDGTFRDDVRFDLLADELPAVR